MVVLKAFRVVVLAAAEGLLVVDPLLLLCGLAGGVDHAQREAHQQRPDHAGGTREGEENRRYK